MRVAAVNFFTKVLNSVGERIYCHQQTDCFVLSQLFNVARHVGRLKLGSKHTQLYVRHSIIPPSQQTNDASSGTIYIYIYIVCVCVFNKVPRVNYRYFKLLISGFILVKVKVGDRS